MKQIRTATGTTIGTTDEILVGQAFNAFYADETVLYPAPETGRSYFLTEAEAAAAVRAEYTARTGRQA